MKYMLSTLQKIVVGIRLAVNGRQAATDAAKGISESISKTVEFWKLPGSEREAHRIRAKVAERRRSRSREKKILIFLLAVPEIIAFEEFLCESGHHFSFALFGVPLATQILLAILFDPGRGEARYIRELTGKATAEDSEVSKRESNIRSRLLGTFVSACLLLWLFFTIKGCFIY